MRTLVIHPFDVTTGFLSVVYENRNDWTIIDMNVSSKNLKREISDHDRIIMLGHGDGNGLYGFSRLFINSEYVYLLREKQCICIWCNANIFVEKYGLKGFYTGMIISEYEEALMYCVKGDDKQIYNSNVLFADAITKSIDAKNMLDSMRALYDGDNPVISFNKKNMFQS